MSNIKMQLQIIGAVSGTFKNDDDKQQDYGSVHVLQDNETSPDGKTKGIGYKADKFSADPSVFEVIKNAGKLPATFDCEVTLKTSAQGVKIKVLSAKPLAKVA